MSDVDGTPTAQLPALADIEAFSVLTDPRFAADPAGATPIHDQLVAEFIDRVAEELAARHAAPRPARLVDAPAADPEDQTAPAAPRGRIAAKLTGLLHAVDLDALGGTDTRTTTDKHDDETGSES